MYLSRKRTPSSGTVAAITTRDREICGLGLQCSGMVHSRSETRTVVAAENIRILQYGSVHLWADTV